MSDEIVPEELAEDVYVESGITELLDRGYDQLDNFVKWSESTLNLDPRLTQQDVFNAESLMDYLANNHRKAISEMNEYDLRWFIFSHYIRKAMADAETEDRLLLSLSQFLSFLAKSDEIGHADWVHSVLDDSAFYNRRRGTYRSLSEEDERAWKLGFAEWCGELEDDLDSRCLLLPRSLGDDITWSENMGWREATLREEANTTWQSERSERLAAGMNFEQMRAQLTLSYMDWVDTPQARLDGLTPAEVILAERMERPEIEDDDLEEDEL